MGAYDDLMRENPQWATFVDEYIANEFNATKAAQAAGYSKTNKRAAAATGSRLLKNANIAAALDERLQGASMRANEVLARITRLARFDPSDLLDIAPNGELTFDWRKAKREGLLYGVESVSKQRGLHVKFEPRLQALTLLGRHHKLFADVVQQGTRGDGTAAVLSDEELEAIIIAEQMKQRTGGA